jgi:hypothetical protein
MNSYKTISTNTLTVSVTAPAVDTRPSSDDTVPVEGAKPQLRKKVSVQVTGHDILPIKDNVSALQNQLPMRLTHYILFISAPPILFFFVFFLMMGFKNRNTPDKMLRKNALQLTSKLSEGRLETDDLLTSLSQAFCYAIRYKSGGNAISVTSSEVANFLQPVGCSERLIESTQKLLEEIESIKFSGMQPGRTEQSNLVSKSIKTIKELCK